MVFLYQPKLCLNNISLLVEYNSVRTGQVLCDLCGEHTRSSCQLFERVRTNTAGMLSSAFCCVEFVPPGVYTL